MFFKNKNSLCVFASLCLCGETANRGYRLTEITRVEKPWGYELHWAKTERYVGKVLHVKAGHALSLQYHNVKDETIFLWTGKLLFEIQEGDAIVAREMSPGESVHITPHTIHRMTAHRGQRHLRGVDAGAG